MKHKLKLLTVILISSVFLTGCFPTGEKKLPSNPTISYTTPSGSGEDSDEELIAPYAGGIVNEQLDNVTFNYEISPDFPAQVNKIKLKSKSVDTNTVKDVILSGKTIAEEFERVPGTDQMIYNTSDGCTLVAFGDSYIFMNNGIGDSAKNYGSVAQHYDKFHYASSEELESFSGRDAIDRVNKILDATGVENYAKPYVIPISPEMANTYLEEIGGWSKDENSKYTPWEGDDGVYVLKYPFSFNGINIPTADLKAVGRTVYGAQITAYVTKDSIFYIYVSALYDLESTSEGTADLKFNAGYASDELIDHYSKLILNHPKFFTECKLEYVPLEQDGDDGIIFTPAWCFMGYELAGVNNNVPFDCAEYYYAETGVRYGSY